MQKKDCFLIGTVFKLHGYKGEVNLYNNNKISFDFQKITHLLIEKDNTLIPYFISKARNKKQNIILVKFEEINSEQEALQILKHNVYISINFVPKSQKNTESEKALIGFKVLDSNLGYLGEISYINIQNPQKLIYVNNGEKEFCFPMHEEFIIKTKMDEKIMEVIIPEEIINLN